MPACMLCLHVFAVEGDDVRSVLAVQHMRLLVLLYIMFVKWLAEIGRPAVPVCMSSWQEAYAQPICTTGSVIVTTAERRRHAVPRSAADQFLTVLCMVLAVTVQAGVSALICSHQRPTEAFYLWW